MRIINSISIPAILFAFFIFGNNYAGQSTSVSFVITSTSSINTDSDFKLPCEVVTIDILKQVLELGDVEVVNKESGSSYPTCRYVWDGGNKKIMNIGGNKTEVDIECNVTIEIVDMEVSKNNYDAVVKSYSDATELLEVGDYAAWSNKRKQMTVLVGKQLFHVHVDVATDNEVNKTKAIELSEFIISNL